MNSVKRTIVMMGCLVVALGLLSCGSLNPKTEGQIYTALEAQQDAFQKCYERALKKNRDLQGDVDLKLKFGPKSKRPQEAKVAKAQFKNPKMLKCVAKAADKVRIEDAPGVFVEGQYTVHFDFAK